MDIKKLRCERGNSQEAFAEQLSVLVRTQRTEAGETILQEIRSGASVQY